MELAILVYVIDLVLKLSELSEAFLGIVFGFILVWFLVLLFGSIEDFYSKEDFKRHFKKYFPLKTTVLAGIFVFLIPNTQTMKYVGAAYLVQTTFESEFVQETATLSQKAIVNQLKEWAGDAPEIKPMLEQIGVQVRDKVQKEIDNLPKEEQNESK